MARLAAWLSVIAVRHLDYMKIEIYDYEASACATKVRWALAEEGLAWTRRRIDLTNFDHKISEYLQVHPEGLTPAAKLDGEVVLGADVIMRRLAAFSGSHRILPDEPEAAQRIARWLDAIDRFHLRYGFLLYQEVLLPLHRSRTHERRAQALARIADVRTRERMADLIRNGLKKQVLEDSERSVAAGFEAAEQTLERSEWLAGEQFSMADIALFPYVNTPMHRVSDIWFGKLPRVTRWLKSMRARPAFIEAVVNHPYCEELWAAVESAPHGGGFRAV